MYTAIRPLLFRFDPEKTHAFILKALRWLPRFLFQPPLSAPTMCMGLSFAHPIGLAAGFDTNAEYITALQKLGFSFIELGTVTPYPQPGNLKPRLFRIPQASALINRMGFNNDGVDVLVKNLQKAQYDGILGINIGKNKDTPLEKAGYDYVHCLQKIYPFASYVTINISSPNTQDLRQLQQPKYLEALLTQIVTEQTRLAQQHQRKVPLVVKLSPDESEDDLKRIAESLCRHNIAGIITTNTTIATAVVQNYPNGLEKGGLSGHPLQDKATACLRILKQAVGSDVALIASGGVLDEASAREKFQAGANLLQVYTGLVYEGPGIINRLIQAF